LKSKSLHKNELSKVHFELQCGHYKTKLMSFSDNGALFQYNLKPSKISIYNGFNNKFKELLYHGNKNTKEGILTITLHFIFTENNNNQFDFTIESGLLSTNGGLLFLTNRYPIECFEDLFIERFMDQIILENIGNHWMYPISYGYDFYYY
jgi:hypothetical protein